MKRTNAKTIVRLSLGALTGLGFIFATAAFAEKVVVISHYRQLPGKEAQLSRVIDTDVQKKLSRVEGLKRTIFFYNPATGERGSVFLWRSRAAWEAYLNSDLRKELVGKIKPYIRGEFVSKSYPVYESE